jgi:hypothetical protein
MKYKISAYILFVFYIKIETFSLLLRVCYFINILICLLIFIFFLYVIYFLFFISFIYFILYFLHTLFL